ncbi:hypothetical protein DIPPA_27758 [Diplonema papillatum]|nr:hypothetical protein DIPPA_27758 [Diplonema papillatum]
MDGAATTEGSISSVVGSTVTAFWNSAKRVHLHIVASTRFAWQLEAKLGHLLHRRYDHFPPGEHSTS